MNRHPFSFFNNLKIRWKMLVIILPLVVIPIFLLGGTIGFIATNHAYKGLTDTSKSDLDHMASFTLDLLKGHYRQFEVSREDKKRLVQQEMKTLVELARNQINEQQGSFILGNTDLLRSQQSVRNSFKKVSIGRSGYLFAMTTKGVLVAHPSREGENIINAQDEEGHFFIRELIERALASEPEEILYTIYPWINEGLGDNRSRNKIVAYSYCRKWDWIVAAGGYLDETYDNPEFEKEALAALSEQIKSKRVGQTGYIYAMSRDGVLTIHPDAEGQNVISSYDTEGRAFIAEMVTKKNGWIHYPWRNPEEKKARMKIVRYRYFEPWDWIIAVGSYEDEFYETANNLKWKIVKYVLLLPLVVGLITTVLLVWASKILTDPIHKMITVMRRVKQGRLDERMPVNSYDELGEMAISFNRMTMMLRKNQELEATLAQQEKMASLGVLSSGVAHEINNPLGVILGYAGHLQKKIDENDPNYTFISEIKRESKRCKKIVQNLLSYSRTPRPVLESTDINRLLHQIIDFAENHSDLFHVDIVRNFAANIPAFSVDMDQLRQVSINLLLNAASASSKGGEIRVSTGLDGDAFARIEFSDDGEGISEENLEKIFEPFFTTKTRGTGLGLAITKQIIEMHQGEIFMESEVGKGTTVVVRLPLVREEY